MTCRHGSPEDRCRICLLEKEVESLKAITELAVKALKQIAYDNYAFADVYNWHQLTKATLSEIERLSHEQNS